MSRRQAASTPTIKAVAGAVRGGSISLLTHTDRNNLGSTRAAGDGGGREAGGRSREAAGGDENRGAWRGLC